MNEAGKRADAEMETIEVTLEKDGVYLSTIVGNSMYPMLRNRKDTIIVRRTEEVLKRYDVALYYIPQKKYVLHRILKVEKEHYIICGDNCTGLEYIPKEWVLGRLTQFYRGEKKVEITELKYRIYIWLWCVPWPVRILVLKGKRRIQNLCRIL